MSLVCAICLAATGHGDILAVGIITMSVLTCNMLHRNMPLLWTARCTVPVIEPPCAHTS
jgi:hypothetical protein